MAGGVPGPRFTADELLATAHEHGLQATRRLITDWVGLGLLDRPHRSGLGQGRGSAKGTWPLQQAQLFLDLLALRQRPQNPIQHVGGLTNVPVAGWLWMAEDSRVPLRQVRLALATWCGRSRSRKHVPAAQARKLAREILTQVDNPHASRADREALRRLIETTIREQTFDAEAVRAAVERVFDPHRLGRSLGPQGAVLTTQSYARMLEAHATAHLKLETFSDEEFEDARIIYRQGRREYGELQPMFASDRQGSPLRFEEPSFENVVNGACRDLLLLLGMGRLAPGRHAELALEAREAEERQTATS